MRIIISIFTFLLFSTHLLTAQINEQYFNDPETNKTGGLVTDHLRYNNTMLIAGRTFDKIKYMPSVMCVDTAGAVLWNTATYDTSSYYSNAQVYHMLLDSLGYLYATSRDNASGRVEYWKIDPATGAILWKHDAILPYNLSHFLIDYDSTRFLSAQWVNTGSIINNTLCFISKANGDTTSTMFLFSLASYNKYNICIDPQKNIYYNKGDSVFKLDANNLSNKLWAVSHLSSEVVYQHFYYDIPNSSIIAFGYKYTGSFKRKKINKIDALTGTMLTQYTGVGAEDVYYKDFKIQGNSLYAIWQHAYVGGGTYPFYCTKYNLTTGITSWDITHLPEGVGSPAGHSGNGNSALSLDLDVSGNIFLTGYYGDANFGPEAWGIMKLNNSGAKLYEKTIAIDTAYYDDISQGEAAFVINNTPYFFGELETEYNPSTAGKSKVTFVKIANSSGNILIQNFIEGKYQFASKIIDIQNYASTQTLVFKQTGRTCRLEMYDYNKNILWARDLARDYFLFGDNLSIAPNGDIYISAHTKKETFAYPYYSTTTDSLFLFKLNSSGNIVNTSRFFNSVPVDVYPTELHASNSMVLYLYQKNNIVYIRSWTAGVFDIEKNTGYQFNPLLSEEKYCFDKDTSSALIFGFTSIASVIKFNKVGSSIPVLDFLPSIIYKINYVLETDTNKVILCSKNNLNKESMSLYNTTTLDTIWTKLLSATAPSEVMKCVTDPAKAYIYSISSNSSNMVVRKLDILNGAEQWAYTYAGVAGLTDSPVDITYDANKDQIIVAGYESLASGDYQTVSFVLGIDGIPVDSIVQPSEFAGISTASCTNVLPDGTQWIGGNVNKISGGLQGFIYEIGPTLSSPNFVWPGDADKTMLVDNNDLLPIGLFYSSTGTARSFVSNAWTGFSSSDWGVLEPSGADIKHADCNGDGIINDNDTLAINQNFSLAHAIINPWTEYRSTVPDIYFVTSNSYVNPGDWVDAELWLGTSSSPVSNLYGLAFNVSYDASLVEPGTESLNYVNSWFGNPGTNALKISKTDAVANTVYGAEVRINHTNADGFGKIATFRFQASTTLATNDSINLSIYYLNAIDSIGTTQVFNSFPLTINIIVPVSVNETDKSGHIKVYPNPFSDKLTILFDTEQQETSIRLIDLLGKTLNSYHITGKELQIEKGNVLPGIYFLQIKEQSKPIITRKIIVN